MKGATHDGQDYGWNSEVLPWARASFHVPISGHFLSCCSHLKWPIKEWHHPKPCKRCSRAMGKVVFEGHSVWNLPKLTCSWKCFRSPHYICKCTCVSKYMWPGRLNPPCEMKYFVSLIKHQYFHCYLCILWLSNLCLLALTAILNDTFHQIQRTCNLSFHIFCLLLTAKFDISAFFLFLSFFFF